MIGSVHSFFRTASLIVLVATGVLVQGSDVQATLIGTTVTVNLNSPNDPNFITSDPTLDVS